MAFHMARWFGMAVSLAVMAAATTYFQLGLPRLRTEWIDAAVSQHNLVIRGNAGNPWQYRLLSDYLFEGLIRTLNAAHLPNSSLFGFVLFRGVQELCIFVLGWVYFRKLGLGLLSGVVGLAAVAVAMLVGQLQTNWRLETYTELVLYLVAGLAVLSRRLAWLIPLSALAALNRETGVFIPLMPLVMVDLRALRSREQLGVYRSPAIGLGVFVLITLAVRFALPSQSSSTRVVTDELVGNIKLRDVYVYAAIALAAVPFLAAVGLQFTNPFVRHLFWLVVPLWTVAHASGTLAMTPLAFLVPLILVLVPGALFSLNTLSESPLGARPKSPSVRPASRSPSRDWPGSSAQRQTRSFSAKHPGVFAAIVRGARSGLTASRQTLAALFVVGLLGPLTAGLVRVGYPFPLERFEGPMLQEVRRVALGQQQYAPPSLEYVPLLYAPVYFYASAGVAMLSGVSLLPLRIVAFAAAVASAVLIYLLVARDAPGRLAGLLAAALFVGATQLTPTDRFPARVDGLCLMFVLAAIFTMRYARAQPHRAPVLSAASGLLIGLAILTKQTAAVAAVPLLILSLPRIRERILPYVAAAGVTLACVAAALFVSSDGWARFYLADLPRNHGAEWSMLSGFWTQYVLPHFGIALIFAGVFFVLRLRQGAYDTVWFYALAGAGLLGMAWVAILNTGGRTNSLPPAYAGLAILFGLGLQAALDAADTHCSRSETWRALPVGLFTAAALALATLAYSEVPGAPLRSNALAGERVVASIAALPGPVFAPDLGAFQQRAGKGEQAFSASWQELLGSYGGTLLPEGRQFLAELDQTLATRQFAYVLLDPEGFDPALRDILISHDYERVGPLLKDDDQFFVWRRGFSSGGGYLTPAPDVYAPRNRAP